MPEFVIALVPQTAAHFYDGGGPDNKKLKMVVKSKLGIVYMGIIVEACGLSS